MKNRGLATRGHTNKGFTLVELMVVVAIIGILASIAISKYRRYSARARQSEAKIKLSSMYTAEQSFFGNYGSYSLCFQMIGFELSSVSRDYYTVGIDNSTFTDGVCGPNAGDTCAAIAWDNAGGAAVDMLCAAQSDGLGGDGFGYLANVKATTSQNISWGSLTSIGTTLNQNSFVIGAAGLISDTNHASNLLFHDRWSIDQDKNLHNTIDGT